MKQVIKDEGGPEVRPQRRRRIGTREQAALSAALPPPIRQAAKPIEVIRDARYFASKKRLEQERINLTEQLRVLRRNLKVDTEDIQSADLEEVAQSEQVRGNAATEINTVSDALTAVNTALHSLEDGTYGRCETCEKDIPEIRLNALPFAKQCIVCVQLR